MDAAFEFLQWALSHPEYALAFVVYQNYTLKKSVELNSQLAANIAADLVNLDKRLVIIETKTEGLHHVSI